MGFRWGHGRTGSGHPGIRNVSQIIPPQGHLSLSLYCLWIQILEPYLSSPPLEMRMRHCLTYSIQLHPHTMAKLGHTHSPTSHGLLYGTDRHRHCDLRLLLYGCSGLRCNLFQEQYPTSSDLHQQLSDSCIRGDAVPRTARNLYFPTSTV